MREVLPYPSNTLDYIIKAFAFVILNETYPASKTRQFKLMINAKISSLHSKDKTQMKKIGFHGRRDAHANKSNTVSYNHSHRRRPQKSDMQQKPAEDELLDSTRKCKKHFQPCIKFIR